MLLTVSASKCTGLSKDHMDFSAWDSVLQQSILVDQVDKESGIGVNLFNYSNLKVCFETFGA
jgi:hypothetical protein